MLGAKILLECLKEQDVDTVFGYPGGAVIPLYDALYDDNHFTHIRTSHEQGAVHGADGYARSTGKVGVCIATSGPGATNTVTGIATAYMDSVPLVVITGQVSTSMLGKDSFQEVDITGITFSITKHNFLVRRVEQLSETIEKAFEIAREGRPGPVIVDIPKDVFLQEYEYVRKEKIKFHYEKPSFNKEDLKMVVELINKSRKPVIYAGGGIKISHGRKELLDLAEKGDIPVVNTLMGLGSIPGNHELACGLVGMHGHKENNLAIANCDLLIAIGARFSDRVIGNPKKFASKAKIIHIDIDPSEVSKNVLTNIFLIGDLKNILGEIVDKIDKKDNSLWKSEIESYKASGNQEINSFHPKFILEALNRKMGDETIVATDVGQHQMWTAQYWSFQSEYKFITSGGLGTMGFGLGAAIGAKVANISKPVLLVTGDGSFRMNMNELFTVVKYNIPIVIVLMNNSTLGMVRQWQRMFSGGRYSETDMDDSVDYVKLASAFGIESFRADSMESLNSILNSVEIGEKPVFIECRISKDESVYPIVPPGQAIYKLLVEG